MELVQASRRLLRNSVDDAHLAAVAISRGATLASFERDFEPFVSHGLRLERPTNAPDPPRSGARVRSWDARGESTDSSGWFPQEDLKVLGAPKVWGSPRDLGESWILFANNARMIDPSGLDSPASESDLQAAIVPADMLLWIDLESFVDHLERTR